MTPERVAELLLKYGDKLRGQGIEAKRFHLSVVLPTKKEVLAHLLWMISEMSTHPAPWDKTMRWVGFIQGCFWVLGVYSIEAIKEDNS